MTKGWILFFNPKPKHTLLSPPQTPRQRHKLRVRQTQRERVRQSPAIWLMPILFLGHFVFWQSIITNFWIIRFMLEN